MTEPGPDGVLEERLLQVSVKPPPPAPLPPQVTSGGARLHQRGELSIQMPSNNNDASIKGGRAVYINAVHRGGGRGGGELHLREKPGEKERKEVHGETFKFGLFFPPLLESQRGRVGELRGALK